VVDVPEIVRAGLQAIAGLRERKRERVRRNRRALRRLLIETVRADRDLLTAQPAPEPRAPFLDRTTDLEPVILDVEDRAARRRALPSQRVGDIVRFERLVSQEEAHRPAKLGTAA